MAGAIQQVLEVVLGGCALAWPWWADPSWALAIAGAYSRYFLVPWAAPNPPVELAPSTLPSSVTCSS